MLAHKKIRISIFIMKMNRVFFLALFCQVLLFLHLGEMSYAQDLHQSEVLKYYLNNKDELYDCATDILVDWIETEEYINQKITITKDVYSFNNKDLERILLDSLQVAFKAKDFSACFINYNNGFFMYIFDENYKEPLPRTDVMRLLSRNLYGVIQNTPYTIYLFGDCPNLITSKNLVTSRVFQTGSSIFNFYNFEGCCVFYLKGNSIELIDHIPDE